MVDNKEHVEMNFFNSLLEVNTSKKDTEFLTSIIPRWISDHIDFSSDRQSLTDPYLLRI